MARAPDEEREISKSGVLPFMLENGDGRRRARSWAIENSGSLSPVADHRAATRSYESIPLHVHSRSERTKTGCGPERTEYVKSRLSREGSRTGPHSTERQSQSEMELMKERFAKLLLGEDMSGGGKGVSSALALSNAITNLAASVFGEQKRLEPMSAETKARWRKEIDWLLSVTDHIVEFVPSKQNDMEVMTTRQRTDLYINIPALRKLDAMLLDCLDNFKDQNEFHYSLQHDEESLKGTPTRQDDKWWIPTPQVPPDGLSEATRKWLLLQRDTVNQVQKAALAINSQVLSEMKIPESYIETLPKNGKAILGDTLYKIITDECFDPSYLFSIVDLSSDHKILDLKNRLEATVVIWRRKLNAKDNKSSWSSGVSLEKRELIEDRAETILLMLKHRFPGLPQSNLEISKIQCSRDVGQAILESYSRVLEGLAFTVLSRIDDVMHADSLAGHPQGAELKTSSFKEPSPIRALHKLRNASEDYSTETPTEMTLSDVMGWSFDEETETKKEFQDEVSKKHLSKQPNSITEKKLSYIETLEKLGGLRSPMAHR